VPKLATREEIGTAAEILARAFADDPVVAEFIREGPNRTQRLARYFELECRLTLSGYGEIWLDDDGLGAAIWRRPGGYPEPASAQLRMLPRYLRLFPREIVKASRAMNVLARVHPKEPHWYLMAVGVVPEAQGQGRGRALLEPALRRCDEERVPAYLEASTTANARLYERLGFESREEVEALPGVRVRPMWRPPRAN
jgi:ribosomal protein S18 acetylase RimI-like enzyme